MRVSIGRSALISVWTVEYWSQPLTYEPGLMPAQRSPVWTLPRVAWLLGHSLPCWRLKAALQNWFWL